jgi:hypothetical protein
VERVVELIASRSVIFFRDIVVIAYLALAFGFVLSGVVPAGFGGVFVERFVLTPPLISDSARSQWA